MERQSEKIENDLDKFEFGINKCKLEDFLSYGTINELSHYLANKGYTKQEWISVEERLPDKDDFYLCMSYCGCYEIYWFNTKHKLFNASDDCAEWAINVPYWMPLPTPPKMKGAE